MPTMSHCRFRNTLSELRECDEALADGGNNPLDELDEDEKRAAVRMLKLCKMMAEDYEGCY